MQGGKRFASQGVAEMGIKLYGFDLEVCVIYPVALIQMLEQRGPFLET